MKKRFILLCLRSLPLVVLIASPARSGDSSTPAPDGPSPVAAAELPLPFGVGFWYFGQEQDYAITALRATMLGFPVPGFGPDAISRIENRVDQFNVKADHWIFPWLNVHGVLGDASGEASATINPRLPLPLQDFQIDYDALIYGGGVTLAAGYRNYFFSLTADYTWADVDMEDQPGLTLNDPNGIETLVLTPKIGYHGKRGALWVGAFYQHTEHTQSGSFAVPGMGVIDFAADVEDKTAWNPVIGGEYYVNEHWSLSGELGFGDDRRQALLGLTYRF